MRILLVDDDTLVRRALTRRIRAHGVTVDEAGGVVEALTLLAQNAYEIVISDENMPDGFGHALLETIASSSPHSRRALMSGLQLPNAITTVWERFFQKPDEVDDIVRWSVAQSRLGDV